MEPVWFLLAAALIGVISISVWLILLLGARKQKSGHNPTPPSPSDHRDNDSEPEPKQHNIVDLAAFRERRTAKGKESRKSGMNQTESIFKKERMNDTQQKAVPGTVRALSLSKSGETSSSPAKRQQKCSYCKKESARLTFYANHDGSLVGVCKECEPIAKRQDLLPL